MTDEIHKILSANDVGETGGHQAGILVPKNGELLAFFPSLDKAVMNPRMTLVMREKEDDTRWEFNFIYYNNRLFKAGTRNEYRLTVMTKYLRSANAKTGDTLIFVKDEDASYKIELKRTSKKDDLLNTDGALVLSGGWTVINRI